MPTMFLLLIKLGSARCLLFRRDDADGRKISSIRNNAARQGAGTSAYGEDGNYFVARM